MKKLPLIIIGLILAGTSYAQTFKIDNGVTINSLKGEDFDIFPRKIATYSMMLGVEYFQRKWYYLSSEIGYLKLGGKEGEMADDPASGDKQTWNYTQLNTSFRLRMGFSTSEVYIGAGPYLNLLLGSGGFEKELYTGYTTQRANWGSKLEAGVNGIIDRYKVGLNCTYLVPVSTVAKSSYTSIDARSVSIYLSLAYRLD
jgi:hypothetical protein